ncbi:GFA family protein [Variovorax boronicumulans]|uniref:GFA family protein n=1 Tax=Variovorax boronicumulans TaxID=436515 RepID=UPI001C56201E
MHLEGSCHCGSIRFSVESAECVPFMRCYCSICRKTAGTGGYAINLGADHRTLKVRGKRHLRIYKATIVEGEHVRHSTGQRHFCGVCGSALWMWDPAWPDLVHPHAGAIDTPLPQPPANVHSLLGSKASWVRVEGLEGDQCFVEFPDFSLKEWHQERGLESHVEPAETARKPKKPARTTAPGKTAKGKRAVPKAVSKVA